MGKDMILTNAGIQAVLNVSWRNSKNVVKTYIRVSSGLDVNAPTDRSWCGDFAYWVLRESGIAPMPPMAKVETFKDGDKTFSAWNTVSRFGNTYGKFKPGEGVPKPGDMYYMQYTTLAAKKAGGNGTNHVGFVVEYDANSPTFKSVDGNSGDNPAILVKGVGGGYVCYNTRHVSLVDFFIPIPN
jgi:hypothetical protein